MRGPSPSKDVRLPPLAAIQAFEAAARLGSFERASEELFVTASAIGKRIAALEAQLDVSLFIRSSRGATLSAAGREYLEQVRTALDLLSDASLHKRGEPKLEPLRVVSTPTFARQVLIPALPGFTAAHPDEMCIRDSSAGGPRLNRGGVPCRCMNLSPGARARSPRSGRSREKAGLRAGGQN